MNYKMTSIFIVASVISIVYFAIKFVEMRFVTKEAKPLRNIVRDSIVVYLAVVGGDFVLRQFTPLLGNACDKKLLIRIFKENKNEQPHKSLCRRSGRRSGTWPRSDDETACRRHLRELQLQTRLRGAAAGFSRISHWLS